MKLIDAVMRRFGYMRIDSHPIAEGTLIHHHPQAWGEELEYPFTLDARLRGGTYVTGDLRPMTVDEVNRVRENLVRYVRAAIK